MMMMMAVVVVVDIEHDYCWSFQSVPETLDNQHRQHHHSY